MTITPEGLPPWTRTASHTQYGGHENKQNYQNTGCINSQTDVGAEHLCRIAADLAAGIMTAPFAVITYLCNDTSPAAPTIESVLIMSGAALTTSYAGDAAPAGYPSAARNGNGDVTITFDSSYSDDYGVAGAFTPTRALPSVHVTSLVHRYALPEVSGQTVRIRATNDAGTGVSDARVTVEVY
jgi:hypothetical protein